jgi:arabinose-5-phosphate isomerase
MTKDNLLIDNSVSFHHSVTSILRMEAEAIQYCIQNLDEKQVQRAVDILLSCQGKIVVLGIGKSGIIAHKIAATMSSIGTPAVYLHAADAMHGDLGIVSNQDVVIAISNSGESEEIISLLPHLNLRTVPVIAIVGDTDSTLARQSKAVLNASINKEACPLNLAPTTSTTVALAIGDALAMTIMEVKGVTSEAFAINHPAGRLGKRLSLRVQDLMHTQENNPVIRPNANLRAITNAITQWKLGAVCVTNEQDILIGIITDGDLRRLFQRTLTPELEQMKAEQIMTLNPVVVYPETLVYDALQLMEKRSSQISVLPVVNAENKAVGLLRIHDIVGKI